MEAKNMPKILYGLHIGEHGFDAENMINEIKTDCIDRGMNFATIRTPKRVPVDPKYFLEWAKYLADNKIYFIFLYTIQHAPEGQASRFTADIVRQMKEIAGEYFLGDMLGELGSVFCGKLPGYYINGHPPMPPQKVPDMQVAKDNYIKAVEHYMDIERSIGMDKVGVSVVEASLLMPYDLEAGVQLPFAELMGRDPEYVIAGIRGSSKAYAAPLWGSYFAHEWYAGHYHDDMLKRKRLEIEYKYAYMSGSHIICHESGDGVIGAHGRKYPADSEISLECRRFIDRFGQYVKEDDRPDGQPITKVAFMQGNLDSWRGGQGGCFVWSQFSGREWGYHEPEWSWKILGEIYRKYKWFEAESYACCGQDFSGQVPYGTYDIIPSTTPLDVLTQYDTIIFAGWNSMTEDQLCRLEQFVEQGGKLLMSAAHLNASVKREGEFTPIRGGDLSKLFGVKLTGKTLPYNFGMKFRGPSMVDGLLYPYALYDYGDPCFSEGYIDYAELELCGGTAAATIENSFHYKDQPGVPAVIEHKLGKGVAILMANANYPGRDASFPLFRFMTRELLRVGVANAKVRVLGPDTLRYSVYESGDVYILNTDFDTTVTAAVTAGERTETIEVAPLELKHIKLAPIV